MAGGLSQAFPRVSHLCGFSIALKKADHLCPDYLFPPLLECSESLHTGLLPSRLSESSPIGSQRTPRILKAPGHAGARRIFAKMHVFLLKKDRLLCNVSQPVTLVHRAGGNRTHTRSRAEDFKSSAGQETALYGYFTPQSANVGNGPIAICLLIVPASLP